LTDLYRSESPLKRDTVALLEEAVRTLGRSLNNNGGAVPKFNKATLFSWLMFIVRSIMTGSLSDGELAKFFEFFEKYRRNIAREDWSGRLLAHCAPAGRLFSIYESRTSSRVADVSSVVLRDGIIWLAFADLHEFLGQAPRLAAVFAAFTPLENALDEEQIAKSLISSGWGRLE
jgi:hypothetical protein